MAVTEQDLQTIMAELRRRGFGVGQRGGGGITNREIKRLERRIARRTAPPSIEMMVGPSGFRGPDFGYNLPPPPGGVESYIIDRNIGGIEFSAFRVSPAGEGSVQWSYTLPSGAPAGRYSIRLTLEYTDVDPAPSFAGLLAVGLADPADDLSALPFVPATDVQVQSVALPPERMSVLEWEFSNPSPKPFVACTLTRPPDPPFAGIIYLYQATLRYSP